jgi:DNA replication protein DnaC
MENYQKGTHSPMNQINYDKFGSITIRYKNHPNLQSGITESTVNKVICAIKNNIIFNLKVPEKYQNSTFDNFEKTGIEKEFKKVKDIILNGFKKDNGENISAIIWSKDIYGVGKTHLLYAMVKEYLLSDSMIEVIQKGYEPVVSYNAKSICVLVEYQLLEKFRETFKPNFLKTEGDIFKELDSYDVLCIDDVSKYKPSNMDFYQRIYFQLVNERYNHNKSLIITTNKSLKELAEYIGIATADRLCEMTQDYRIEFRGKSYRAK